MPNLESFTYFIPELILAAVSILLLCMAAVRAVVVKESQVCVCEKAVRGLPSYVAAAGVAFSFYFLTAQWGNAIPSLFEGLLSLDRPAEFFKLIFVFAALAAIVLSRGSSELGDGEDRNAKPVSASFRDDCEYYALILGLVIGVNLLAGARNILMIYLALEFVGLTSYLLTGYSKNKSRSSEAALKYVLFGAVASGVFLFGASILYGVSGSLDISAIANVASKPQPVYFLAGIFVLGGFLFKTAAVPMQAWCPDVYEGAPTPVTMLLSIAPKAAGFAVLMRVANLFGAEMSWPLVIAIISAATMTFGNFAAITQTNVKRLLAYSSIAHAGYLLMSVACASAFGNEAVYFYFIAYLLMNAGAFAVVQVVANKLGSDDIAAFTGLGQMGPYGTFLGIAMTIFLLSLTGVPPFLGFIGKFYLFSAVIKADMWWLAIIGIINSVVSLYYYMRIVKAMFFDKFDAPGNLKIQEPGIAVLIGILAISIVVFGILWGWIASLAKHAAA